MTQPATSVVRYCGFFSGSRVDTVLEYGAGTLRNALYLIDQGFTVYAADLPEQVKVLRGHPAVHRLAGLLEVGELALSRLGVDLVISTYVFNIIVQQAERQHYLQNVVANLRPGGFLLMEVCCRRDQLECGSEENRQFKCSNCSRTYTHHELDRLMTPYGLKQVCHYYSNHAVAVIYQLAAEPYPVAG